ncbi:GDSL-type esterase/lipase family protein [Hydrogenophaga sp. IBVHS2]|uniref:GDSL-type esterase/lipase family protein n=1 Tax=Hydrogenophaga sp. IBVHS2 TaxID=1985170 RepID=UPI0015C50876|nr:GDSL-type esterase/lipase family protein [Hydrogenophaga sp. IBVHS2]
MSRWRSELDAFALADRQNPPRPGGVLFVGSSSIRLWQGLESAFPGQSGVQRRGVGGSCLYEWADWVAPIVLPHRPRLLLVYAGENDLTEGRTPHDLLASFIRLADRVRADLPDTRLAYLSIKPSPSRMAWLDAMREANLLIQTWVLASPNMDYVDVHTPMIDNDGRPRAELFVRDQLHLSAEGYALWRQVVSAHLRP